jgi:hypothetical protein
MFAFKDGNYVLGQLLKAKHITILFPIYLEGTIWKTKEGLAQLGILSQLLHIVEALPADDLCNFFYSVVVP